MMMIPLSFALHCDIALPLRAQGDDGGIVGGGPSALRGDQRASPGVDAGERAERGARAIGGDRAYLLAEVGEALVVGLMDAGASRRAPSRGRSRGR